MTDTEKRAQRVAVGVGALLFLCVLATGLQPIRSMDFWHHIASGRLVWETGYAAQVEVFSHTALGRPWIQFEWLAQLLLFLGYTRLGAEGVVILKAALIACGYLLLWLVCRRRAGDLAAALVVMAAAVALVPRSYERPELFSWLFLGAFMLMLELGRAGRPRLLLLLPLITAVWANTHGMYVAALALLGITAATDTMKRIIGKGGDAPTRIPQVVRLWPIFAVCLLGTLANPYFYRIWEVPWRLMSSPLVSRVIGEWGPSTLAVFADPYFIGLWLLCIVTLATHRDFELLELLVFAPFAVLAWRAYRQVPLLAFVCAPIFSRHLALFLSRVPWPRFAKRPALAFGFAALALPALAWVSLGAPDFSKAGFGVLDVRYPQKAADFLDRHEIRGNLFNTYEYGNYFMWRLWPKDLVFIDGRVDVYGDAVLRQYEKVRAGAEGWQDVLAEGDVVCAVLRMPVADERADQIVDKLIGSPGWRLVHWDDKAFIFITESELAARRVAGDELRPLSIRPDAFDPVSARPMEVRVAIEEFGRVLGRDPRCALAHAKLAECHQSLGAYAKAIVEWRRVLDLRPESGLAFYNLGLCQVRAGEYDAGEGNLRKALSHDGPKLPAYRTLGNSRFQRKDYAGAADYFRKARRVAPNDARILASLSAACENAGDLSQAIETQEELLRIAPSFSGAREKLRELTAREEHSGGR